MLLIDVIIGVSGGVVLMMKLMLFEMGLVLFVVLMVMMVIIWLFVVREVLGV